MSVSRQTHRPHGTKREWEYDELVQVGDPVFNRSLDSFRVPVLRGMGPLLCTSVSRALGDSSCLRGVGGIVSRHECGGSRQTQVVVPVYLEGSRVPSAIPMSVLPREPFFLF